MSEELQTVNSAEVSVRTTETVALEIRTLQRQAEGIVLSYAIEIGRRLEEVKAMLPHGEWGNWLKKELDYSQSTAQNFMRVFREYGDQQQSLFGGVSKTQAFGNLTYSKALRLLAIPEEEREEFVEQHDVTSMSTRELDQAIKARDEALERQKAAENIADGLRMKLDSAEKKAEELQNSAEGAALAMAEAQSAFAKAEENRIAAEQERAKAQERVAALQQELEELLTKPKEVETVVDQEAVEKARNEATEAMQAKLDKAKDAKAKAEEKQKAAEDALAAANAKMRELEEAVAKQVEDARAEGEDKLRSMEKQLAASDPNVAEFKVLYAAWQEDYQKMVDALGRIDQADSERAVKLKQAVKTALEQMGGDAT